MENETTEIEFTMSRRQVESLVECFGSFLAAPSLYQLFEVVFEQEVGRYTWSLKSCWGHVGIDADVNPHQVRYTVDGMLEDGETETKEQGMSDQSGEIQLLKDALDGKRGADQKIIAETALSWSTTLLKKNNDYGSSVWQVPVLAPECSPGVAIRVRMSDKINRLGNLLSVPSEVADETYVDTVGDLGAYCLLLLAVLNLNREEVCDG